MGTKDFIIPENLEQLEEAPDRDDVLYAENLRDFQNGAEADAIVKEVTLALGNKDILCIQQQDVFDKVYCLTRRFGNLAERSKVLLADSLASNLSCLLPSISSALFTASSTGTGVGTPVKGSGTPNKLPRTPDGTPNGEKAKADGPDDCDDEADDADGDACYGSELKAFRTCYKLYVYFLYQMIMASEVEQAPEDQSVMDGEVNSGKHAKGRGRQKKAKPVLTFGLQWETQRGRVLRVMADATSLKLVQLYQGVKPEENLLDIFCRLALTLYESKAILKDEKCRKELGRMLASCCVVQGHVIPVTTGLTRLLFNSAEEGIGEILAEVGQVAETEYRSAQVTSAVLQEICRTNPKEYARASGGAHQAGSFLVAVADRQPRILAAHLALLMPHLEYGESYVLRNSIILTIGRLVLHESGISADGLLLPEDQGQGEEATKARRLRSKQGLLGILLERTRDSSAYVRSKVLQTWSWLCERKAIPLGHWNAVVDVAAGRLQDKSSLVRKSALQLLSTLLQQNPFGPELQVAEFEITLEKYRAALARHPSAQDEAAEDTASVDAGTPVAQDRNVSEVASPEQEQGNGKSAAVEGPGKNDASPTPGAGDDGAGVGQEDDQAVQHEAQIFGLEQTRALVASLEAGLKFAKQLNDALDTLALLLASSTTSDVEHCIQLLISLTQFQIDGASQSLRKILPLALSNEPSIREAVEKAIYALHLEDRAPDAAARSLMDLAGPAASLGEMTALDALMQRFMQEGQLSTGVIFALWDFFTFNQPGTTPGQSTAALSLLAMAARGKPQILSRHIAHILDIGLGRRAANNPVLAQYACIALQRLSDEDKKTIHEGHRIFTVLANILLSPVAALQKPTADSVTAAMFPVSQQAIRAVYVLHPAPEQFCAGILRKLSIALFGRRRSVPHSPLRDRTNEGEEGSEGSCVTDPGNEMSQGSEHGGKREEDDAASVTAGRGNSQLGHDKLGSVSSVALTHLVFTAGQVALEHLVYVGQLCKNIRKAGKAKSSFPGGDAGPGEARDAIADELGAAAANENELEVLQETIEKQIVANGERLRKGKALLVCSVAPLVVELCRSSEVQAKSPSLHGASIVALSKLMAIDSSFCENNLQLLFTVLRRSTDTKVRSNVMIALGDLTLRWPNLLEPWTENMYEVLRDKSTSVRRDAVLVLSHLILNDMMKVKGFISELAICLEDGDKRIADLTGLFFHELSRKGSSVVYNLLPDMLSRMSENSSLSDESLRNILQFLINLMNKDKQMEGLIDKITHRFAAAQDVRLWRTLSFCLTLLSFSDRGIKKMVENYKEYKDTLVDEEVLQHLLSATSKAKKFAKPEVKATIEELEEKMQKQHDEKKEEEQTAQNALEQKRKREAKVSSSCIQATETLGPVASVDEVDEAEEVGEVEVDEVGESDEVSEGGTDDEEDKVGDDDEGSEDGEDDEVGEDGKNDEVGGDDGVGQEDEISEDDKVSEHDKASEDDEDGEDD